MPQVKIRAGDIRYFGRRADTFVPFVGYPAALAGAVAFSVANGNAPVQLGLVQFAITQNPPQLPVKPIGLPVIALAGNGVPLYVVDLASAGSNTYDAALVASYSLSRSIPLQTVVFSRLIQIITAP